MPGLMGGYLAQLGTTTAPRLGWISSGFWGAIVAGFAAGLAVRLLNYLFRRIPQELDHIKTGLLVPLLSLLFVGVLMVMAINPPLGRFNAWLSIQLDGMQGGSRLVLGTLLGGMMATDYGGPINKAAYVSGTLALVDQQYDLMAAVMAGGMIPPLGIGLACLLCVVYIRYKVPVLQLGKRWLVYDGKLLRKTVSYGWASAMQQATVQLGKIAVQAIVNTMGVNAMAAFTAASRIDDFAYTPQQNIGHAMTTLMAQNRGAGKADRVRQGYHCGMRIEFAYGILLTVICLLFAEPIIRLFAADPAVVDLGVRFLRTISLFYLMPAATNGIQGFFRGMGDLKVTLNSSMLNMGGRVAAAALFVLVMKMDIEALPFSYAVGWLLMLLYELPLLVRFLRSSEM